MENELKKGQLAQMGNSPFGTGEIVVYKPDAITRLEVKVEDDTVWLTQEQIALLFDVQRPAITKHVRNILASHELEETSVCSILERTATDDKQYKTHRLPHRSLHKKKHFAFSKMTISPQILL